MLLQALKKPIELFAAAVLVMVLAAIILTLQIRPLFEPIPATDPSVIFEVESGSSLQRIADRLQEQGLVHSSVMFTALARWRGVANSIQTGEYELQPGLTPAGLLDKMARGEQIQYRVTLVEGWTFAQVLDQLWAADKLTHELRGMDPAAVADSMGLERENPEGLLFPDTYFYTSGTSDLDILLRAHRRLQEVLQQAWSSRSRGLPYNSPYEALIMASIVEKESSTTSERGHIAGVFVRRLERGMRLQSDPTIIYGMGENYNGNIRRTDLNTQTPYNTYRIDGLPPTPIALVSRASIQASLNPLSSDYLYFVARGDGTHQFSTTLEEHNAAVDRYQRRTGN